MTYPSHKKFSNRFVPMGVHMDALERIDKLEDALKECEEYFDARADADHNGERYVGNAEMDFLTLVRSALGKGK